MKRQSVAIYARVSTDRQASTQDGSIDAQLRRLRAAVERDNEDCGDRHEEFIIYDEYVDAGESGKDLDRPQLTRLLGDVKSGRVNHIKVTKLDRITRSLRDFCELKDLFDKHRVSFNSLEDKFDTTTPMGEAMVNIVMVFAELERKMTSQRTKETMVSRAEQGLHNGGRIWGYKLNPDRPGVLLIDEEEARTIRRIFQKYLEVKSLTQLQRWMQRENVLRPEVTSRRKRKSGGTVPTVTGLRTLLQNPVYIGQRQTAKGVVEGKQEAVFKKDSIEENGRIEIWNAVQEKLESRSRKRGQEGVRKEGWKDDPAHVYILRGLVYCGHCGSAMTPDWATGANRAHHYYTCTNRLKYGVKKCSSHRLPATALENAILTRLQTFGVDQVVLAKLLTSANTENAEKLEGVQRDQERVRRRLKKVEEEISTFIGVLRESGASALTAIKDELASLEKQKADLGIDLQIMADKKASLEAASLNHQVTYEAFRQLKDILVMAEPKTLERLLPLIIQKIVWTNADDGSRDGCYKMALYANPMIPETLRLNEGWIQKLCSGDCEEWLPG